MVERNVGQMSLADGLVQAPRSSMLDELEAVVDWVPLRSLLGKRGGAGAGNSSYPAEVLLRCLLAGIWHNLSDPALEAAIADRLSFRHFVGLSLHDQTPDHTTLWRFRQELAKDGLIEKIFTEINRQLEAKKLILKQGTLVDASLIPARANPPPRQKQRNKLIAKVRAAVERPYAVFKENYGLRRLRFFNLERNQVLIVLACCAYNLRRAAGALAAQHLEVTCA
jgi:IS5 family transposase